MNKTSTLKSGPAKATTVKNPIVNELPRKSLELLTPEQFEAVTVANYWHCESKLVLELFLQTHYLWQISRHLQNKPASIRQLDWARIEKNSEKLILSSLAKLLPGISREPWNPENAKLDSSKRKETDTANRVEKEKFKQVDCGDTRQSNTTGLSKASKGSGNAAVGDASAGSAAALTKPVTAKKEPKFWSDPSIKWDCYICNKVIRRYFTCRVCFQTVCQKHSGVPVGSSRICNWCQTKKENYDAYQAKLSKTTT